jgi:hypothetical protein
MLARFPLNPILPAKDGPRAEAFYAVVAFLVEGIEERIVV